MANNEVISPNSSTQQNETMEEKDSKNCFFNIHDVQDNDFLNFASRVRIVKVEILTLPPSEHFLSNLKCLMKGIFEKLTDGCDRRDLMSFEIVTDNLKFKTRDEAFKPIGKLSHTQLENLIEEIVYKKAFDIGDSFEIRATHIKMIDRNSKCGRCEQVPMCTDTLNEIRCNDCLFDFYGPKCHANHLKSFGLLLWTRCQMNRRCRECKKTYDLTSNEHDCRCQICKSKINSDHKCYMPKLNSNSEGNYQSAFLFYDFEAMQEKNLTPGKKLHEVNLCVAQLVCHECFNCDLEKECTSCKKGRLTYIFRNDPVGELLTFIDKIKLSTDIKRLICIAHNSQKYDAQFILKYIVENKNEKLFLILKGKSITLMSFDRSRELKIEFIDSFNYFDMKLAKLPETFRLEGTYKKGFFPHLFNIKKNQKYKGTLPEEYYYDTPRMNDEELLDFQKWYTEMKEQNYVFDFKKEIVDYCLSDVNILRKACYAFRKIERVNIDPFVEGCTMASVCMKVFRTTFLRPNTIGIIPNGGYRRQNQSNALNPRDAFYGGRIETYTAHREISGDGKIHHIDICSLYPWVNKYGKVPIGHPHVYFGDDCNMITGSNNDISRVEGLIKCKVLAPRNLYQPVLPVRINDRTMFSLCRLCSENSVKDDCHHDKVEDREFTGTWVSDELKKAIEKGYCITHIYEIWQYEVEQYNTETRRGGIFTDYVNEFLQLKQSASGWPTDYVTPEDRQRYIDEYREREGIELIAENIEDNPGLRFIGKKALNCLWGRFGLNDYGTDEVIRSSDDLLRIVNSPDKKLASVQFIEIKSIGYCKWMYKDDYIKPSGDKNVAIAVYTTAQARLKLYEYLERLDDRVLYCHTDSCIYTSSPKNGHDEMEIGNFLGDMTNALANKYGNDAYIREFVSCSSNLYSMIVVKSDGTEKIITKGVPIEGAIDPSKKNYSHENIKALALGEIDKIEHSFKAIRTTKCHDVATIEQNKTSKKSFDLKRKFPSLHESLPYGSKRSRN